MSYYIRVATSNLGNILSTESISPASLYPMRKSGYRRFEHADSTAPNKTECFLRLYKEPPSFAKSDPDRPTMLIMMPNTAIFSPQENDGFTWTTETIYLEPQKGFSLIFENEDDLNSAFTSIIKNSEAKFANDYRRIAITACQANQQLAIDPDGTQQETEDEIARMEVDRFELLDRLKGAIYCYQLDKMLSIPGDQDNQNRSIACMEAADELVNTITQKDDSRISEGKQALENELLELAMYNEVKKRDKARKNKDDEDLPNREDSLQALDRDSSIEIPKGVEESQSELKRFRTEVEQRIREISHQGFKPTSKGKMGIKSKAGTPTIALPTSPFGKLAEHLVNWLVANDVYHEENNSIGYPFARKCGAEIKRTLGEFEWTNKDCTDENARSCQEYVNGLLERLNESKPFDIDNASGIDKETFEALRALALLCAKDGNDDLESFYRYLLLRHKVTDFRLPFAIWGAVFGFSKMPKTLCDQLDETSVKEARKLFAEAARIAKSSEIAEQEKPSNDNPVKKKETAEPPTEKTSQAAEPAEGDNSIIEANEQDNTPENEKAPAIVEEDAEASA